MSRLYLRDDARQEGSPFAPGIRVAFTWKENVLGEVRRRVGDGKWHSIIVNFGLRSFEYHRTTWKGHFMYEYDPIVLFPAEDVSRVDERRNSMELADGCVVDVLFDGCYAGWAYFWECTKWSEPVCCFYPSPAGVLAYSIVLVSRETGAAKYLPRIRVAPSPRSRRPMADRFPAMRIVGRAAVREITSLILAAEAQSMKEARDAAANVH